MLCRRQSGQYHYKILVDEINYPGLIGAHRDSTNNQEACKGEAWVFCICYDCVAWCSCETTNMGVGVILDPLS